AFLKTPFFGGFFFNNSKETPFPAGGGNGYREHIFNAPFPPRERKKWLSPSFLQQGRKKWGRRGIDWETKKKARGGRVLGRRRRGGGRVLEEMGQVVPWAKLCGLIEPHYPKPGNGRRPKELEQMLRIYFLQQWFNLADPAVEEALYDSATLSQFAGIDLGAGPGPNETTSCRFRHRTEGQNLGEEIMGTATRHSQDKAGRTHTGRIVDR